MIGRHGSHLTARPDPNKAAHHESHAETKPPSTVAQSKAVAAALADCKTTETQRYNDFSAARCYNLGRSMDNNKCLKTLVEGFPISENQRS
jgi:hypothetical protein